MYLRNNKTEVQFKASFIFSKTGFMRYISHLDLMRLMIRAARRAELPLYFSKGFSPRPKLAIKKALKLGLESENEEAHIILTRKINSKSFQDRFNKQLPQGVRIKESSIS
ncbi:MAG: TIGR03936 family radical SAM-associated protein [Candidatus Omnitrophica bacterium]|nr:TIGR03936 family radical SAM-associated protein [Candidatus Omnitrophota bacterium]MDD5355436.1 TIGR03936 family radical SAM-associated protein [Candidatus Omnitrophota bacterium]